MTAAADLARVLAQGLKRNFVQLHQAVIYSVASTSAEVYLSASTTLITAKFVNYKPTVGETVLVFTDGEDVLIWGKVGGGSNNPRCRIRKTISTSYGSGAGPTTVNYDTADYDSDGIWTAVDRLSVPSGLEGVWHIDHAWKWAGSSSNGRRMSLLHRSGLVIVEDEVPTTIDAGTVYVSNRISLDLELDVGQYVATQVYQDSGAGLANRTDLPHNCYLSMHYIGPLL